MMLRSGINKEHILKMTEHAHFPSVLAFSKSGFGTQETFQRGLEKIMQHIKSLLILEVFHQTVFQGIEIEQRK